MGDTKLPPRAFLYAPEQIAQMLNVAEHTVRNHLYYEGRSTGIKSPDRLRAINVAPDAEKPIWRIEENEVVRWFRYRGIRLYEYRSKEDS